MNNKSQEYVLLKKSGMSIKNVYKTIKYSCFFFIIGTYNYYYICIFVREWHFKFVASKISV